MSRLREHPIVSRLKTQLSDGKMDRREFIRMAALLGVSAGAAYAMAGVPSPAWALENSPFPADDPNAKAGGILRVAMQVQKIDDPATFSWIEGSNEARQIIEYLTMTGPDNITRPMLAESWEASDDLKTWTFHLRQGVMWHNGEELVADHIAWNVQRWLDGALGSSNVGLSTFSAMLMETGETNSKGKPVKKAIENAVEVVDAHTVRFNLSKAVLSVPEDCYNYPTAIVHPSFKAPSPTTRSAPGLSPWPSSSSTIGASLSASPRRPTARTSNTGAATSISMRSTTGTTTSRIRYGTPFGRSRRNLRIQRRPARAGALRRECGDTIRSDSAEPLLPHAGRQAAIR